MLGTREPGIYGNKSLAEINETLVELGGQLGAEVDTFQSNHEGELVTRIQEAGSDYDVVVINAGAYTHTSVAIRDAFLSTEVPLIEVHLSNIHKREQFRHESLLSDVAQGVVMGFGHVSYELGLRAAVELVNGMVNGRSKK